MNIQSLIQLTVYELLLKRKQIYMAVKSWYLSVVDSATHKNVVHKMFFTAPEMNKFIREQELVEKYPKPTYYLVKENY